MEKKMEKKKSGFYPEAVVFDMDGLMFDSERIVQESWNKAGEKMGYGLLGDENIHFTLGFNRERRKIYFREKYGADFPYEEFQDLYAGIYNEYVKEKGVSVKKGLYELLEVLENRGIPRAVATSSSRENALENLKRAGILEKFQAVVTGDMVREGKPSPEIYITACRKLKVPGEKAVALEDAPNGILAAKKAGMHTVFVPDILEDCSGFPCVPDRKAESLQEVAMWLAY